MSTVETQMFNQGDVDEAKYTKFVAKTAASYRRARDKGKRDYAHWTDEQCQSAANSYCGMYRHHFRTLVPVAPKSVSVA